MYQYVGYILVSVPIHILKKLIYMNVSQVSSIGTEQIRLEDGSVISILEVVRTVWHLTLVKIYLAYCEETDLIPLSRSTLNHKLPYPACMSCLKAYKPKRH